MFDQVKGRDKGAVTAQARALLRRDVLLGSRIRVNSPYF